jgi:hypothetical protein
MNRTKPLTGACSECGGAIEFPAELVGTATQCPHCRKQTELRLAMPPEEPAVPRKVIVWTAITAGILVLGLVVAVGGLKHFERLAAQQKDRAAVGAGVTNAAGAAGFEVSGIALDKGEGSTGECVVGTVVNTSNRARSRVTLEVDLVDGGGRVLQVVRAYRPVLEAGAKWQVKVPVTGAEGAVKARVASIRAGE